MLYDAYEVQRSFLAGASKLAGLGAGWLNNPANPWGYSSMGPVVAASLEVFAGDQRDGVRFLAAGASCAPDAHRTTACPLRADRVHQKVEVCLLTKEAGVIGGEAVNQLNAVLAGMIGLQMFIKN